MKMQWRLPAVVGFGLLLLLGPTQSRAADGQKSDQPSIDPATARLMLDQLQTLRSQFELWKLQHGDRVPDLQRYPKWEQFTQHTNAAGNPDADGKFGPYLNEVPRNALNGSSTVALVKDQTKPQDVALDTAAGFAISLPSERIYGTDPLGKRLVSDKLLVVIANKPDPRADAASAQPTSRDARLHGVALMLQILQSQIALYQIQHRDQFPDLAKFAAWEQLTNKTDADGNISQDGEFGPYLPGVPRNPITGFSGVAITTAGRKTPQELIAAKVGFIFSPKDGKVWAVDEGGKFLSLPPGAIANP